MRMTPLLLAAGLAVLSACSGNARGAEQGVARDGAARQAVATPAGGVAPGIAPQAVLGNVRNPHAGDAEAAAEGRQFFVGFNCGGCHSSYAGGGMGPSLRDSLWIYGSSDVQIFSTIAEGRPYGMPAWGGRIPDDLIWKIVTYINTLGTDEEPVKPPKARG
jgi:cytochrome c oxidase cbb3-type subunit 3